MRKYFLTFNFNKTFIILFAIFFIAIYNNVLKSQEINNFDALHYEINLLEVNVSAKTINAKTNVKVVCEENNIDTIFFDLLNLTVDFVFENSEINNNFVQDDNKLIINLNNTVNKNDTLDFTIYYNGTPFVDGSNWGGFHFSGEYAFNLGVGFESIPHNLGKAWFPCFDNFTDKALFDVLITVPETKKGISGGLLHEVITNIDGTKTWHWKTEKPLPTYLISATIGNYSLINDSYIGIEDTIPITYFSRPADSSKVLSTFVNLKEVINIFENHFGSYPLERIGLSATGKGAMEHACNISYPYSAWNGNTNDEWWYIHELSHMWFGNTVTCETAGDMWLNEGWAVWTESFFREKLYGIESGKNNMRTKLKNVLKDTYKTDGGYYALHNIPDNLTYGSTVYDKGGQVVHTLRNYLGDSIFFSAVKEYINTYKYSHSSSDTLKNFLTNYTGIDMQDFFDTWVFSPGFPHFSIDSAVISYTCPYSIVSVNVRQKLKELPNYGNNNKVEITFVSNNWDFFTDTMVFSGPTGNKLFYVPFDPVSTMLDYYEKISDATTDQAAIIKNTGTFNFTDSYFTINTTQITDSALVRVTHNWIAPDSLKHNLPGLRLSDTRYWTVEGIFKDDFITQGKFSYTKSQGFELNLTQNSNDSIVILYRKNANDDWHYVPQSKSGTWIGGIITVDTLKPGEYTLAAWDYNFLNTSDKNEKDLRSSFLNVYPNPSNSFFNIENIKNVKGYVHIYDVFGKFISKLDFTDSKNIEQWFPPYSSSYYIFVLHNEENSVIDTKKAFYYSK